MTSWSSAESHRLSFFCQSLLVCLDLVNVVTASQTVSFKILSFCPPSGIISNRHVTILSDISQTLWLLSWSDLSFFAFTRYLKTDREKQLQKQITPAEMYKRVFGEQTGKGSSDISHLINHQPEHLSLIWPKQLEKMSKTVEEIEVIRPSAMRPSHWGVCACVCERKI